MGCSTQQAQKHTTWILYEEKDIEDFCTYTVEVSRLLLQRVTLDLRSSPSHLTTLFSCPPCKYALSYTFYIFIIKRRSERRMKLKAKLAIGRCLSVLFFFLPSFLPQVPGSYATRWILSWQLATRLLKRETLR